MVSFVVFYSGLMNNVQIDVISCLLHIRSDIVEMCTTGSSNASLAKKGIMMFSKLYFSLYCYNILDRNVRVQKPMLFICMYSIDSSMLCKIPAKG